MTPHLLMPAIMAPLIALVVWRRVRTQFGRQPVRRHRMMLRIAIFAVLGVALASASLHDLRLLGGLAGGAVAGAALGLLGLRLTRFERNAAGEDAYIPNPWLGALITALLIGRLAWRLLTAWPGAEPVGAEAAAGLVQTPALGGSALTLLTFGLLVGYYLCYFSGLLLHHRRFLREHGGSL